MNVWTIARATYGFVVRKPLFYATLAIFAILIYCSSFLTQFTFSMETQLVREMGLASIVLWGFIITTVLSGIIVTQELEDRTAVTLLSKPIRRSAFLLGKFLGLMMALTAGMFVLAGILFYTLWMMAKSNLFGDPALAMVFLALGVAGLPAGGILLEVSRRRILRDEAQTSGRASRRFAVAGGAALVIAGVSLMLWLEFTKGTLADGDFGWELLIRNNHSVWDYAGAFMKESGIVVLQGFLLSVAQVGILATACVCLSAFLPVVVSVSATTFLFILGNLSGHMQASLDGLGSAPVSFLGRVASLAIPHFGLLNLQTHFSEGRIISPSYLGFAVLHAVLYAAVLFTVSCALFERREIR